MNEIKSTQLESLECVNAKFHSNHTHTSTNIYIVCKFQKHDSFVRVLFEVGFPVEAEGNGGWSEAIHAHIGVRGPVRPLWAANYSKPQLLRSIQLVSYNHGHTSMPLKRSILFFLFFFLTHAAKTKRNISSRADGVFACFFFFKFYFIHCSGVLALWLTQSPSPLLTSTCPESCHPQQKLAKAPLDKVLPSMPAHHSHHRHYWPIIHALMETRKQNGGQSRLLFFFLLGFLADCRFEVALGYSSRLLLTYCITLQKSLIVHVGMAKGQRGRHARHLSSSTSECVRECVCPQEKAREKERGRACGTWPACSLLSAFQFIDQTTGLSGAKPFEGIYKHTCAHSHAA